jgi:hypothetical protein
MVERFAFTAVPDPDGEILLRPLVPITLMYNDVSIEASALLDSGADVNVLPYRLGLALGAIWDNQPPLASLSGNLGNYESRGILLTGIVPGFASLPLVFSWTQMENVRLILGQMNFFDEFNVCFFRTDGVFELQTRS